MADRVLDQVEEDALDLLGVGLGERRAGRQLGGEVTPRSSAGVRMAATVSPIRSPQLDLAHGPGDVAGLDPRELEEVVDQVAEHGDVGADLGQVAVAVLAVATPSSIASTSRRNEASGVRRSCEAAATRPRRASSTWRRIRSSIVCRTARPVATAAAITATTTATSLGEPHLVGDRDHGGARQEGGGRDQRGARHPPTHESLLMAGTCSRRPTRSR